MGIDKTKTVLMVFGLSRQLDAWLTHARDMGHMTRNFKYRSGVLIGLLRGFIAEFGADDDMVYEHSVQISELFERIAKLDEEQIKRVSGLLTKIENDKTKSGNHRLDKGRDGEHSYQVPATIQ